MVDESRMKRIGTFCLGLLIIAAVFALIGIAFRGIVWASGVVLPSLVKASSIVFNICVLVLLPLCIFRKTRKWAGIGLYMSSYLFGTALFAFSCIVVLNLWGYGGLIVGLLLGGIGVVPLAFLATLFKGVWSAFWFVIVGALLTYGARALGLRLSDTRRQVRFEE
jgi:hypothetical protein